MQQIRVSMEISIVDPARLVEVIDDPELLFYGEAAYRALVVAAVTPAILAQAGIELTFASTGPDVTVTKSRTADPTPIPASVTFGVNVLDAEALVTQARLARERVWQDGDSWAPETLGEAAFELLVASNQIPAAPNDLGLEIGEISYPTDAPAPVVHVAKLDG